ncbi:MAG TPA: ABC transporter ATP-binding protein [Burkholderiaceae bacterium]|nr:ABC transporter ATP-binding protein [Burkholderiaceae bacterium]
MPPAIEVQGLTKRYGARTALDALSLGIPRACFAVLLGPNGAGKSTLFQILTGLFAADAGDARLAGHSIRSAPVAALASLGVVFQQPSLDLDLSVERNLRFHAALHGMARGQTQERIEACCIALGIAADRGRMVRELSGGNRRKVELARALLHRPSVLLMDEPTVGLDPASRRDLLAALRADVEQRGTTVLWATHLVEETSAADRVLVLHRGRLLAEGRPDEVTQALGGPTLESAFIAATGGTSHPKETAP